LADSAAKISLEEISVAEYPLGLGYQSLGENAGS
jgi:hypothetical protein